MRKKTMMWVGAAALAALAAGGIAYASQKPSAAPPPAKLPPGTVVTSLTPGQQYAIAAMVPAGVTDTTTLVNALTAAHWTNVNVFSFLGTNATATPSGLTVPIAGGYGATAIWGGAAGPVPPGLIAVAV